MSLAMWEITGNRYSTFWPSQNLNDNGTSISITCLCLRLIRQPCWKRFWAIVTAIVRDIYKCFCTLFSDLVKCKYMLSFNTEPDTSTTAGPQYGNFDRHFEAGALSWVDSKKRLPGSYSQRKRIAVKVFAATFIKKLLTDMTADANHYCGGKSVEVQER